MLSVVLIVGVLQKEMVDSAANNATGAQYATIPLFG
jgi:hypothetical protein